MSSFRRTRNGSSVRGRRSTKGCFRVREPRLKRSSLHTGRLRLPRSNRPSFAYRGVGGSLMWGMGKLLYDRASGTNASEATVNEFMDYCPPFRALIYSLLLSWYDRGVRDRQSGEKFTAGRNDLFMAVYLPYCDQFVTAEIRGEQEKCLRAVASAANLETKVLSRSEERRVG